MSDLENMKEIVAELQFSIEKLSTENENLKNAVKSFEKIEKIENTILNISENFKSKIDENLDFLKEYEEEVKKATQFLKKAEAKKFSVLVVCAVSSAAGAVLTATVFLGIEWVENTDMIGFILNF